MKDRKIHKEERKICVKTEIVTEVKKIIIKVTKIVIGPNQQT